MTWILPVGAACGNAARPFMVSSREGVKERLDNASTDIGSR
jgi:hypothetical protein